MAASVKVIDRDLGLKKILVSVKELEGARVKVGIISSESHEGTSVLDIAMYNEFGTSNIPARPFMSTTYDKYSDEMSDKIDKLGGDLIDGKLDADKLLNVVGLDYSNKVKTTIRDAKEWAAPNAPSTIKQKGSSSPLIDTGRMLGAVNYEIEK